MERATRKSKAMFQRKPMIKTGYKRSTATAQ